MRYYVSDWTTYEGKASRNWEETNKTEAQILDEIRKDCWVYDADTCGDDTLYVAFSSGKYYKIYHDWYITYDPEWEIHNSVEITEVRKEETKDIVSDRDWLILK